ncbi:hypothetical protein GCM10017771_72040 [Streptomyces capitiformicae]|uniref:Uncharacterized protein n=1 Tax=Streptomyces capitiformicae TaxID=2014920 RepID=A0A918ZFD1_9ACTN|nr:hypothetical protein GCM10017771_72040 [Streptomyces capitiformicae]
MLVPAGVVTVTLTGAAGPAGTVAVICVALTTLNDVGVTPNTTEVALVNPVPWIVITFPPAVGP